MFALTKPRLGVYSIILREYSNTLRHDHKLLTFESYYPLIRALSASGSFEDLATEMTSIQSLCNVRLLELMRWIPAECEQDTTVMGSFSENHDQPRFASYTSDISVRLSARRIYWKEMTNVKK